MLTARKILTLRANELYPAVYMTTGAIRAESAAHPAVDQGVLRGSVSVNVAPPPGVSE
jgi:hypothetical protein